MTFGIGWRAAALSFALVAILAAPPAHAQSGCAGALGTWAWSSSGLSLTSPGPVEVRGDGSFADDGKPAGTWHCADPGRGLVVLRWRSGWTDTLTLAADGRTLEGRNQHNYRVTGRRIGAAQVQAAPPSPAATPAPIPPAASAPAPSAAAPAPSAGPPQSLARAPAAIPAAAPGEGCDGFAGSWAWAGATAFNSPEPVELRADGFVLEGAAPAGTWECVDPGQRIASLHWRNGAVDMLGLAADGRSLRGANQGRQPVSATRLAAAARGAGPMPADVPPAPQAPLPQAPAQAAASGCEGVLGTWSWSTSGWAWSTPGPVVFRPDGSFLDGGAPGGTWSCVDPARRAVALRWKSGWTDTLTLSADARALDGTNQLRYRVAGRRLGGPAVPAVAAAPVLPTRLAPAPAAPSVPAPAEATAVPAAVPAPSVPPAGPPEGCAALLGTWTWFSGGVVDVQPDGAFTHSKSSGGTWTCTDAGRLAFAMRWRSGWIDQVTVARDGETLSGRNQHNYAVSAVRVALESPLAAAPARAQACSAVLGGWRWLTNIPVVFEADGTVTAGSGRRGNWVCGAQAQSVSVRWSDGSTDSLAITSDGRRLAGRDSRGSEVFAVR